MYDAYLITSCMVEPGVILSVYRGTEREEGEYNTVASYWIKVIDKW